VQALVARVEREQGRLMVNDMGAEYLVELNSPCGSFLDRAADAAVGDQYPHHQPLCAAALKSAGGLVVEITDGTAEYNKNYRLSLFYDLLKTSGFASHGHWRKSCNTYHCTAVAPGWLRSELMLDYFGVRKNWQTQRQRNRTSSFPKHRIMLDGYCSFGW